MSNREVIRAPIATYRVQLNADFGFDQAAGIADYLWELGISHFYASPYLQAAAGSTHGYDVVDPAKVSREIGGPEAHENFCLALGRNGLGQILDIVPNHMALGGRDNMWWWDVLENGRTSRYANYFDIDWDAPESKMQDKVLVPILGDIFGKVIDNGHIQFERLNGAFGIRYFDQTFPVAPVTLVPLYRAVAEKSGSSLLGFLADSLEAMASRPIETAEDIERRDRDYLALEAMIARACAEECGTAAAINDAIADINNSPNAIESILRQQHYRLAYWRAASYELNYRRFFNVNSLVGLRIENEEVFHATHGLILQWVQKGVLDGLRIDHPDGLHDPEQYMKRLRELAPDAYIVVEKILEPGEALPTSWPVSGTTGYDFLYLVGNLFVDPRGEREITDLYSEFTGEAFNYAKVLHDKKNLVLRDIFGAEINRLTEMLVQICEQRRHFRDYARDELRDVLREIIACFPIYRTYVVPDEQRVSEHDIKIITEATAQAQKNRPDLHDELFDFLRDLLLARLPGPLESDLVMRFQQLTGPAMAKGAEDTAFYNYNRLISLNEVGGAPSQFGISVEQFHQECLSRQDEWPQTMLETSTHDTKRSEDVRMRINLLSEIPERWCATARRWAAMNQKYRQGPFPDRNAEYLLYQTLIGAWPIEEERAAACMHKSSREAKRMTTWTDPNEEYERTFAAFVHSLYGDQEFMQDLQKFVEPLIEPTWISSLSQTLIKLTAPGIPDIYQGCEVWNYRLVDPDNRLPVDFGSLRQLMNEMRTLDADAIWERRATGMPKMLVIQKTLQTRRNDPDVFGPKGAYQGLPARGNKSGHVVAYMRGRKAVVVVPRLLIGLAGDWEDTALTLPEVTWKNVFTGDDVAGGAVMLKDLLSRFPVALLVRGGEE